MRKDMFVAAVYEQRESLLRRLAPLSDAAWDLQCPTPAPPPGVVRLEEPVRRVRDLVAHLLVVDDLALRSPGPRSLGLRRLEQPGGWDLRKVEPLARLTPAELVALLGRRGAIFGKAVSIAPAAMHRVPVSGPFGRQPLGRLIGRRVLHEWLHEQDIAAAASPGAPEVFSAAVAEVLADTVLQSLPGCALSRTDIDAGVIRVVVDLTPTGRARGSVRRSIWGIDFARRQYGPRVLAPADATVRVDVASLALIAHGRTDRLPSTECVDIDGNTDLAGVLLAALWSSGEPAPCVDRHTAAITRTPAGAVRGETPSLY